MRKARSGSQDQWLQVAATYAINSIEVSMLKPCILHQFFFFYHFCGKPNPIIPRVLMVNTYPFLASQNGLG